MIGNRKMAQLNTPAEAAEILRIRESWLRAKAAARAIPVPSSASTSGSAMTISRRSWPRAPGSQGPVAAAPGASDRPGQATQSPGLKRGADPPGGDKERHGYRTELRDRRQTVQFSMTSFSGDVTCLFNGDA
jgi:hypothetical protein